MIISASRRTDIPAFYSDWFLQRLHEGNVIVPNPYNKNQLSKIILSPQTVDCIVFWSKNPAPMLDKLDIIDKLDYKYYFQFTLTPYGKKFETNLPEKEELIETFHKLAKKTTVIWRYDPVILSDELNINFHLKSFEKLAKRLHKHTDRCVFSYVDIYAKLKKLGLKSPELDVMKKIACGFADIAQTYGLKLSACCEEFDFSNFGVTPSACIDKNLLEKVIDCEITTKKHAGQRKLCNCIQSIDIGMYDSCTHGCIYCYANKNYQLAIKNRLGHNKYSPVLLGEANEASIKEKHLISLQNNTDTLF